MPLTPVHVEAPNYHPDVGEYEVAYEMTDEEFLRWDHGGFAEWVDGRAYKYMMVLPPHQVVVQFLVGFIQTYVEARAVGGRILTGPAAMRVREGGRIREPDVVYLLPEHTARITNRLLEGPGDLVIEVVSPDSPARDRVAKLAEYESAGVREYWIVDPRPRVRRVEFFGRDEAGTRFESRVADAAGVLRSSVVPSLWIRPEWLLSEQPDVLTALREVVGLALPPGGPRT